MRLIKIEQFENGGHNYQTINRISSIPEGWAVIPDDMDTPNLPYGDIVVEEIEGVPTVTSWTPREMPEVEPTPEVEAEPTAEELIDILLGVNENE
jgi:hypothetical protein